MHINKWRLFWIHYGVIFTVLFLWSFMSYSTVALIQDKQPISWYTIRWDLLLSPTAPFPNALWPSLFGTTFYLFVFQDFIYKKYRAFSTKIFLFVSIVFITNILWKSYDDWLISNYTHLYFPSKSLAYQKKEDVLLQSFWKILKIYIPVYLNVRSFSQVDFSIAHLLYTAFFTLVMYVWQNRKREEALEKQQREVEIQSLKAQLNPHFLFNSLNTIYSSALSEKDTPTAQLVQQLSGILRHSVEEIRHEKTSLEKELAFIEKYLALQRARLPQNSHVSLTTSLHWDQEPADIAPLLLIPFIENAFQYGISLDQPSFVVIRLEIEDKKLHLRVENSLLTVPSHQKGAGTGLPNVQKRLQLLYPHQHTLRFGPEKSTFLVDLTLQL